MFATPTAVDNREMVVAFVKGALAVAAVWTAVLVTVLPWVLG